jgi:hypothetical protein
MKLTLLWEKTNADAGNCWLENQKKAVTAIDDSNAGKARTETIRNIELMLEYETLSMEALVDGHKGTCLNWQSAIYKDHVEEIKKHFLAKFKPFVEKEEEFQTKNQIHWRFSVSFLHDELQ